MKSGLDTRKNCSHLHNLKRSKEQGGAMIEPTMIHASATLPPGRGRDLIFPPPCHFGKQAIMIYDDSFSPGSPSPAARRNNMKHRRKRRAAVRATVT